MTDQPPTGLTLRQRVERHTQAEDAALDSEIADFEHQLVEHGDLPRIAQMLLADERQQIEGRLAALRTERARRRQIRAAAAA